MAPLLGLEVNTTSDIMFIILAVFLGLVGIASAILLIVLARMVIRNTFFLNNLDERLMPILDQVEGTLGRVNKQLDKVDVMTDSVVDAVDSADTAVRAVSFAVTKPVKKVSGAAAGLRHGASALWAGHDVRSSVAAARDAAARRERDLDDELAPPSGRIRDRAPRAEPAPSDEDASLPEPGEPEA